MPTNKSKDCDDNLQLEKSDFDKINPPNNATAHQQINFMEFLRKYLFGWLVKGVIPLENCFSSHSKYSIIT